MVCVCTLNTPAATPAPQAATEGFPVWNQPGLDNEPLSQKQANALIVLWSHYQCGGIWCLDRRGQLGIEDMCIVPSSSMANMVCCGVCVCVCVIFSSWIRRRHCFLPTVNSGFMKSSLECRLPFWGFTGLWECCMVIYCQLTEPADAGSTGGDSHITFWLWAATLEVWKNQLPWSHGPNRQPWLVYFCHRPQAEILPLPCHLTEHPPFISWTPSSISSFHRAQWC